MNDHSGRTSLARRPALLLVVLVALLSAGAGRVHAAEVGDGGGAIAAAVPADTGSVTDASAAMAGTSDVAVDTSATAAAGDTAAIGSDDPAIAATVEQNPNGPGVPQLIVSAGGPYQGIVGRQLTLTGQVANPPASASLSWLWVLPDNTTRMGQTIFYTPQSPGNGLLRLQVTASNGASGSDQTTINTGGQSLSIVTTGPYGGMAGQQVFMSATVAGANAPFQTTWSFGDGTTGTGASVSHVYSAANTYVVTVSASSGSTGQSVPPVTTTATISQPAPTPITLNPGGPYSGTTNNPVSFYAFATPAAGNAFYQWTFGDGTSGNGQATIHAYAQPGSYSVSVTVTIGTQSASAITAVSIAGGFNVSANGPYGGTAGQGINFTANARNPQSTVYYRWNFGDGTSSGAPTPLPTTTHAYASPGAYTVTLTGTAGLTGQSAATSTAQVSVVSGLQISAGGQVRGTVGQPVTLSVAANGAPADTLYTWQFGDGTPPGFGLSVSHVYNAADTFTATVTASSNSTGQSASARLSVLIGAPQSLGVVINAPGQGTVNSAVTFSAVASGNFPGSAVFSWNFGDNTPSQQGAQVSHTYSFANTYTVTVTASSSSNPALNTQQGTSITIQSGGPSVTYQPGWNVVSGPAGTVFAQAGGVLYTFQAGNSNYSSIPSTQGVDAGKGYWAFFNSSVTVSLNGAGSTSASVPAAAGQWVMIGNPSGTTPVTVSGADSVVTFNPATNTYTATTILAPGQGAWALSTNGGTITLSAATPPAPPR